MCSLALFISGLCMSLCVIQEDDRQAAVDAMYNDNLNKQCLLNVEYKRDGLDYVSLLFNDNKVIYRVLLLLPFNMMRN